MRRLCAVAVLVAMVSLEAQPLRAHCDAYIDIHPNAEDVLSEVQEMLLRPVTPDDQRGHRAGSVIDMLSRSLQDTRYLHDPIFLTFVAMRSAIIPDPWGAIIYAEYANAALAGVPPCEADLIQALILATRVEALSHLASGRAEMDRGFSGLSLPITRERFAITDFVGALCWAATMEDTLEPAADRRAFFACRERVLNRKRGRPGRRPGELLLRQ